MKLKDILGQTDWQDVEADLTAYNLSPGKDIDAYRGVFESLSTMAPAQSGYILQMDIHRESPDFRIGYPVAYGVAKEDGRSRSLAFAPWAEWLGMEVDGRTFELFSFGQIAACCLCEMTAFGFSEEAIKREERRMLVDIENAGLHSESLVEIKPEDLD